MGFDAEWPQAGVQWAGPKAGISETISRAGFEVSAKAGVSTHCRKCAHAGSHTVHPQMFSQENLQHLGPQHPELSNLTWYESLLIQRVHPVVSVITLTTTGLMCYAGHACNYYVKVLDWVKELPAKLRDKRWFLVKRRKSVNAAVERTAQKKPTTANRLRLEAAIRTCVASMPEVYRDSYLSVTELAKFPVQGEIEMLEQEESVDLTGVLKLDRELFAAWLNVPQEKS